MVIMSSKASHPRHVEQQTRSGTMFQWARVCGFMNCISISAFLHCIRFYIDDKLAEGGGEG